MKTFRQFLKEDENNPAHPEQEHPREHTALKSRGYVWMANNGPVHQYFHPTHRKTVLVRGTDQWDHVDHNSNKITIGHGHGDLKKKLNEDSPDAPYETPANFNRDNVPKSTSKKTPMPENMTTLDQIDNFSGQPSKTVEKPFKSV